MNRFLISYDLVKTKDYQAVYKRLESNGAHRLLESVWVASFEDGVTASAVVKWLRDVVDDDDKIVAVKFVDHYYLNAKPGTNGWFTAN